MSDHIWQKYMHVERLDSEEVEGLLEMEEIWVEPKIDGANASVLMDNDGILRVAKRSQVIGKEQDFRGLAEWVYSNQDNFLKFFEKYPNTIIYGEWLIKHTIGYYRPSAWKHFYAFDILDLRTGDFFSPSDRVEALKEFDINQIAPMVKLKGPLVTEAHLEQLQYYANNNKYLIDEEGKVGEGIVIKGFTKDGVPYRNKYGRTTWAKIVRQEFKEKNSLEFGARERPLKKEPEPLFAETFVTPARVEKMKQKIMTEKGTGWKSQYIAELLGRIYYDVFTEELWGFIKKEKVSSINFKTLQKVCLIKTKQIIGL